MLQNANLTPYLKREAGYDPAITQGTTLDRIHTTQRLRFVLKTYEEVRSKHPNLRRGSEYPTS